MNNTEMEEMIATLKAANVPAAMLDQIVYCMNYESTVTALEARLRGSYQFQEIITDALATTMNFYDADSALVISLDMDLMIAKPEFETHREDVLPVCGTEPMYLNEYPEMLAAIRNAVNSMASIPYMAIEALLPKGSKALQRLEQIGIHSIMAMPYKKRSIGYVAVINPRKHTNHSEHNSLLQVLSYVTVAEINEMNLTACRQESFFDGGSLAPNDIYVKLLNGFELRTCEGTIKESDLKSEQCVLLLTHLLVKKGTPISEEKLIEDLWDGDCKLDYPERTLRNLSYRTKAKIAHIFPQGSPLEIGKMAYSVSRKYNVITDLDWFGFKLRDIQGISDVERRIASYERLLDDFTGFVLPMVDHRSLTHIEEMYEERRETARIECLAQMYDLKKYSEMHYFINRISLIRVLSAPLVYWDIKASIGMRRYDFADNLLRENKARFSAAQREELEKLIKAAGQN